MRGHKQCGEPFLLKGDTFCYDRLSKGTAGPKINVQGDILFRGTTYPLIYVYFFQFVICCSTVIYGFVTGCLPAQLQTVQTGQFWRSLQWIPLHMQSTLVCIIEMLKNECMLYNYYSSIVFLNVHSVFGLSVWMYSTV